MPQKSLHTIIKKFVKQYGAGIVEDHRLKGLLADELGESFDYEAAFEQAYKIGVGKKLFALCNSRGDVSLKLDGIKQNFSERSLLERPISFYIVDCMAYGLGLVAKVKMPSLEDTTLGLTQKITQLNEAIARKDAAMAYRDGVASRVICCAKKIRAIGILGMVLSAVLLCCVAGIFWKENAVTLYDGAVAAGTTNVADYLKMERDRILNIREMFAAVSKDDDARINELLEAGVDVKSRNSLGENLLFAAVRGDNLKWAKRLIAMGLAADERNQEGKLAYEGVRNKTASYVKNVANRNEFFVISVRNNKLDSAKYFISLGADLDYMDVRNHYTAAHYAVYYNNVNALEKLKSWGVNLNKRTSRGTPIELALAQNRQKAFRYLLGAVPGIANQELSNGERLLHRAIRDKNRNVWVGALLAAGANIHQEDASGNQPIHVAAQYGDSNLVKMFIDRGVDPKVENKNGDEVVEIAERYDNKNVVRYMSQYYIIRRIKGVYDSVHNFVAGIFE